MTEEQIRKLNLEKCRSPWLRLAFATSLAIGPCAAGAVCAANSYGNRVFPVGWEVVGVEVADVNGDGRPDLVTANYAASYLSLLIADGEGAFLPEIRVPTTSYHYWDIAAADLNGDGTMDLVAGGAGPGVSVWLQSEGMVFGEESVYSVLNSTGYQAVAIRDFDGDGKLDIVAGGNQVMFLKGLGNGLFNAPTALPLEGFTCFILAEDLDGNGHVDLAGSESCNDFSFALSSGPLQFGQTQAIGAQARDAVAYDFDGDGWLDFATAAYGSVRVVKGAGEGTFEEAVSYPSIRADKIVLADMNGDHHPDLVLSGFYQSEMAILVSNGDGTFQAAQTHVPLLSGGAIGAADFDSDGAIDIALASLGGPSGAKAAVADNIRLATILRGDGAGGLVPATIDRFGVGDDPEDLAIGDFDGNGQLDIVTANTGSADLSVALGNGDGTFLEVGRIGLMSPPLGVVVGRFDSDAVDDLAVIREGLAGIELLIGNGDGTFAPAPQVPLDRFPTGILRADLDQAGADDLITTNFDTNDITVVFGVGNGSFATPTHYTVGEGPRSVVAADLDGQSGLDLATANRGTDDVSLLISAGSGMFLAENRVASGIVHSRSIAAGDFNGDAFEDLVVTGFSKPAVSVLYGDGLGGVGAPVTHELGGGAFGIVAVDVDGDLALDLVTSHGFPMISVLNGDGVGGFFERREYLGGSSRPVVGDFNRDGMIDVAGADDRDRVAVLLNQTPQHIEFAGDKITLRWPHLVGYDSFNIYRGTLSDLADNDGDGLPDTAYGTCRNDLDLTDNRFVDEEVPEPGQGYFYLMSRVRDGVETELGSTSAGSPRVPAVPCVLAE